MATREEFEAAILDNPDEKATYSAYADWLQEQGDPRGEFIAVQLALEDESRPKEERDALKEREKVLLAAHAKEWVGRWADVVAEPVGEEEHRGEFNPTGGKKYEFRRGWITTLNVSSLLIREAQAILEARELRFVRNLFIGDVFYGSDAEYDANFASDEDYEEREETELERELAGVDYPSQFVLLRWPQLRHIRRFHFGWPVTEEYGEQNPYNCLIAGDEVFNFVKQMPDIEELYCFAHRVDTDQLFQHPMPQLRALQLYHLHHYPLEMLAGNATLSRLEHLACHPGSLRGAEAYIRLQQLRAVCRSPHLGKLAHLRLRLTDFGDEGAREIVDSGVLKRLKSLDLRHGCITDEGARTLAANPDLKKLEFLDLSRNAMTDVGIQALREVGIKFDAEYQHGQGPQSTGPGYHYLEAGDYE